MTRRPLLAAMYMLHRLSRRPYYVPVKSWDLPGPPARPSALRWARLVVDTARQLQIPISTCEPSPRDSIICVVLGLSGNQAWNELTGQ
jgi:hypothetical protein